MVVLPEVCLLRWQQALLLLAQLGEVLEQLLKYPQNRPGSEVEHSPYSHLAALDL